MTLDRFRHRTPLRVRWAEVDQQGVVFNGHYLLYADVCLTEYWRAIGMVYPQAMAAAGCDLYARKATVEFHAAAVYDDPLQVCGRIDRIGASSLTFAVAIFRDGEGAPLATIELVYVSVDLQTRRPQPVPPQLRERIAAFEPLAPA